MKYNLFKDYFSLSKSERNGMIVLVFIILLLIFVPAVLKEFYKPTPINNLEYYNTIDSFFSSLSAVPDKENIKVNPIEQEEVLHKSEIKPFFFDPNSSSLDEFIDLGLTPKQAQVIIRYREKGGRFFKPDDFAKMYVIDSNNFRRLKPWIRINTPATPQNTTIKSSDSPSEKIYIELNSTDTIELIKVKGLGRVFARRIVSYRNLLGGFTSIDQLKEVWGFSPEVMKNISPQLWVDSTKIQFININLVGFEDLKKHPYLTEYQAKGLIYYRSKVGTIKSVDELLKQKIIPPERYYKVKPYLKVD